MSLTNILGSFFLISITCLYICFDLLKILLYNICEVKDMRKIKYVAHRGGKGYGVENTIEAFWGAINGLYDGIECDIQPTKDKKLVVCHDLDLKRLTGKDLIIKEHNYDELKDYELVKCEKNVERKGKLLLFEDLIKTIAPTPLILFVELKESCSYEDVINAIDIINKYNISSDRIIFIANLVNISLLVMIRSLHNEYQTMYVARTDYQKYVQLCLNNGIGFDACFSIMDAEGRGWMNKFIEKGLPTSLWVLNTKKDLKQFNNLNVDYITTDVLGDKK